MTNFFIPVDSTGSFNTGLALFNPGQADAVITMRLINTSGQETRQAMRNLAAGNHIAQFVAGLGQIFPDAINFRGVLRVTATVPITAMGLRQNDPPLSYTSIPAVPSSSTRTTLSLAHVANGSFGTGSFKTSFLLFNISSGNASVNIALTRDNGQVFQVTIPGQGTNSTFNVQLAPGGSAFLQTDGSGALLSGAASIVSSVPLGAAAIFTVFDAQGKFQTEAGVGDSPLRTAMTLPVDVTGSFNTGAAFFVPGNAPAVLNIKLLDANGSVIATASPLVINPGNHTAQFITQLFPGTANFRGSLAITSSAGTAALTLRQNDPPLSYTTLPVAPGAAQGTQPTAGPMIPSDMVGINAMNDGVLDITLRSGYRLTGVITGPGTVKGIYAQSETWGEVGTVNRVSGRYEIALPAGTYNLMVKFTPSGAPDTLDNSVRNCLASD